MLAANGKTITFDEDTPPELQQIIAGLMTGPGARRRVRVFLGDVETGRDWNEENDVTGYIGCSMGPTRIPLLVNNARSLGGGALSTGAIVKLVDIATGRTLYQHPNYHTAKFTAYNMGEGPNREEDIVPFHDEYKAVVYSLAPDAGAVPELYAHCRSYESAYRLAAFMEGKRHNK